MAKHKITKAIEAEIKLISQKLPALDLEGAKPMKMTVMGSRALENGTKQINDGTDIDANKRYVAETKFIPKVNHKRRLTKAYESEGWDGVNSYLLEISSKLKQEKVIEPQSEHKEDVDNAN